MSKYTFGRPPLYESPEQLEEMITDYFENGVTIKQVVVGFGNKKKVVEVPVPTITGLVLHCGFDSRQSFYDYEQKDDFSYTIKKARTFIENEYEEILQTTGSAGAIFALKNFGWCDERFVGLSKETEEGAAIIREFADEPDDDLEQPKPGSDGESDGTEPDGVHDDSTETDASTPTETS